MRLLIVAVIFPVFRVLDSRRFPTPDSTKFGFEPPLDRTAPRLRVALLTTIGRGALVSFWIREVPAPIQVLVPELRLSPAPTPEKCNQNPGPVPEPVKSTVPPVMFNWLSQ